MDATEVMEIASKKAILHIHIPDEIIIQILSKLAVRSLLRFKSVCKLWQSLISDPEFSFRDKGRRCLIFCPWILNTPRGNIIHLVDDELSTQELPHPLGSCLPHASLNFLGSCNGLLLFYTWSLLSPCSFAYLWNPSTRSCRGLPEFKDALMKGLDNHSSYPSISSGLWFDESSDDYKAVVMYRAWPGPATAVVISLRDGTSWRDNSFPYIVNTSVAVLANSHLHWKVYEQMDIGLDLIVYFDQRTNKFNKLPTPGEPGQKRVFINEMGVLDGCLCICRYSGISRFEHEILIMREHGIKESWTSLCIVSCGRVPVPLFSTKSGEEILFAAMDGVLAYNVKNKSYKNVLLHPHHQQIHSGPRTCVKYVESLASVY